MKNYIVIVFLVLFYKSDAQTVVLGKVLDNFGDPVSYVTIKTVNNSLFFSDSLGRFKINNLKENETLTFSCVGFQTQSILAKKTNSELTVSLLKLNFQLNEVLVNDKKSKTKMVTVGNPKISIANELPNPGSQYVIYLSYDKERSGVLKSVSYFMRRPPGGDVKAPFRVRIYALDTINNKPGEDLLKENLIVNASKNWSWFEVDLEKYNIIIPKNGFFVAMEILMRDSYAVGETKKLRSYSNNIGYPGIGIVFTKKGINSWMFSYNENAKSGRWREVNNYIFSIKTKISQIE